MTELSDIFPEDTSEWTEEQFCVALQPYRDYIDEWNTKNNTDARAHCYSNVIRRITEKEKKAFPRGSPMFYIFEDYLSDFSIYLFLKRKIELDKLLALRK